MSRRVPVLRQDNVLELRRDLLKPLNDGIAARHGQCPAGTEIVLHIDDDEDVLGGDLHGSQLLFIFALVVMGENKIELPLGGVNFDDFMASGWMSAIKPLTGRGRAVSFSLTARF